MTHVHNYKFKKKKRPSRPAKKARKRNSQEEFPFLVRGG
jgi:hypothetical protein